MTRCSDFARERGDSLDATAPPATRWLLLELPGPWGASGILDSRLPRPVARALKARTDAEGLRLLLIRRVGRSSPTEVRSWALVDSRSRRTTWSTWSTEDWLVEGPLPGTMPDEIGSAEVDEPTYLVCTHGRHDACCAVRGRPVAQALADVRPGRTWESSHVGGDRFSANVVVLPWGLYYGQVDANEADALARLTDDNRVLLSRFRGQAGLPQPAQAAQVFARRHSSVDARDALAVLSVDEDGDDRWLVTLDGEPAPLHVTRERVEVERGLTCAAPGPTALWRWHVGPAAAQD